MKWTTLHIFLRKPVPDKLLLLKIMCLLGWYRLFILVFSFKKLAAGLGTLNHGPAEDVDDSQVEEIEKIAASIRRVSYMVPWEAKCLVQAVTGKQMLKNRNIDSTLYLGVKKEGGGEKLVAHAWLSVGNKIILGGNIADEFTPVSHYT